MERHNTHLLSDSLEDEGSEENHKFIFNNSKISTYSNNISLYSNSVRKSSFKLDNLKENSINSIVSSKDIEDIFFKDNKNSPEEKIKLKIISLKSRNYNCLTFNYLTYSPHLIKKIKINDKKRNCISLNNSLDKPKKSIKRPKINQNQNIKIAKLKKLQIIPKYENNNFENDVPNEAEKKLNIKSLIDLINKNKNKSLQITKNSFSIKRSKIISPISVDNYYNNKYKCNYNNHYIQHQKELLFEQDDNLVNYNYLYNYQINAYKRFQYSQQQNNNFKEYSNNSRQIFNSSNIFYNNSCNKNKFNLNTLTKYIGKNMHKKLLLKSNRNQNKIKELYNLYCKNPNLKKKNYTQRIKSAFTLKEGKIIIYTKNNFKIFKSNINLKVQQNNKAKRTNNELLFYNNSYWLEKLIKLKNSTCLYHYDKHFGSNENCPLCQKLEKKNEESIIKKGIHSEYTENKKNESKNSSKSRRIRSAITRHHVNQNKNESFINTTKSRNLQTNRSGIKSAIINEKNSELKSKLHIQNRKRINLKIKTNNSIIKNRKLKINKIGSQQNIFSYNNFSNIFK